MNPNVAQSSAPQQRRTENLALAFQEVLTAVVRLRSGRQEVNDAELFRQQVRAAMRAAHQDATRLGYVEEDIRLAVFATVAFLDESVLNLRNPAFAEWVRKPLQEEMFGGIRREILFENPETPAGPGALELATVGITQQCIFWFAGKYSPERKRRVERDHRSGGRQDTPDPPAAGRDFSLLEDPPSGVPAGVGRSMGEAHGVGGRKLP